MKRTVRRKEATCHDKLIDCLFSGPKNRDYLIDNVGIGFASRVSEFNKVYKGLFKIINSYGLYSITRTGRVEVPYSLAYPGYHNTGKCLIPKKQIQKFGRRIDNL